MPIPTAEPATALDDPAVEVASELVDRAEIKDGHVIVDFSRTQAGLATLKAKYSGPVPDVTTRDGMEQAKAGRREMVALRTALEDRRKALKAPALDFGRKIDTAASALVAQIRDLEEPYDSAIKAEESRKEEARLAKVRAEEQRIREHEAGLAGIKETPARYLSAPSADIRRCIEQLEAPEFLDHRVWEEYEPAAREATRVALEQLRQHLVNAEAREQLAALQAKQAEEQRQREAEQARVAKIKDRIHAIELAPGTLVGLPSRAIGKRLQELQVEQGEGFASFGEFAEEARLALDSTIRQLQQMQADAEQAEADAALRAVEQQELQRLRDAEAKREREAQAERERVEREQANSERMQREAQAAEAAAQLRRIEQHGARMLALLTRVSLHIAAAPLTTNDPLADEIVSLVAELTPAA
jgi:hypothetical protein